MIVKNADTEVWQVLRKNLLVPYSSGNTPAARYKNEDYHPLPYSHTRAPPGLIFRNHGPAGGYVVFRQ